jgi:hypothetical protein
MTGPPIIECEWTHEVAFQVAQIRSRYRRQGQRILDYTVNWEIWHSKAWQPVVRYDNAHWFCHCDTMHADGSQDKTPILRGDANPNFTWSIKELRANWESHRSRFLAEAIC